MTMAPGTVLKSPGTWWTGLTARILGRDGSLLLLARMVQMANGFILSVLLVRMFGLPAVGTYTIAAVAISALSLLCALGLPYSLPRETLSERERNTVAACWAVLIFPVAVLGVMLFAWAMARHPGEWMEITLFGLGGYFFGQTNVLNVLFVLQQRTRQAIVPPVMASAGMIAGIVFSKSLTEFAAILLLARACASIWLFARMKYRRVRFKNILLCGISGFKYSPMDFIGMLSEQTGPLVLAGIVTRAQLGLYGLCLKCLSSSDAPGWSVVQAYYPELVKTRAAAPAARSRLIKLSLLVGLIVIPAAFLLGRYVYRVPEFALMMTALAFSVPSRYLENFYDQTLRAAGHIRIGTRLAIIRLLLSILFIWLLAWIFGLWGAIFGLIMVAVTSSALYGHKALPILDPTK